MKIINFCENEWANVRMNHILRKREPSRIEPEESKQNFINEFCFLIITEKGRLVFELLKWQKESVKAERQRIAEENYNARKNMAEKLLKAVGLDLADFTDCED